MEKFNWYFSFIKDNYTNFKGRLRRRDYWTFVLMTIVIELAIYFVVYVLTYIFGGEAVTAASICSTIVGIIGILLLLPSLGISIRRLHDTNKSGWLLLLAIIPIIGSIILLIIACIEGTRGPNKYGEDPKANE